MAELKLGPGVKAAVFFVIFGIIFASGFYFGKKDEQGDQVESEVDVLSIDSAEVAKITEETKEAKVKTNEHIKDFKEPIVDADGYLSDEFLQLLQSKVDEAKRGGDQTNLLRTLTHP